jgi:hypothetical protein
MDIEELELVASLAAQLLAGGVVFHESPNKHDAVLHPSQLLDRVKMKETASQPGMNINQAVMYARAILAESDAQIEQDKHA